jgi:conjugative relaxase-like TrwC/TraI family protein
MMSIGSVKSAGSAGNYYTDKDNYYVIGSMDERWQGKGAEALGIDGKAVDKALFTELLREAAGWQRPDPDTGRRQQAPARL